MEEEEKPPDDRPALAMDQMSVRSEISGTSATAKRGRTNTPPTPPSEGDISEEDTPVEIRCKKKKGWKVKRSRIESDNSELGPVGYSDSTIIVSDESPSIILAGKTLRGKESYMKLRKDLNAKTKRRKEIQKDSEDVHTTREPSEFRGMPATSVGSVALEFLKGLDVLRASSTNLQGRVSGQMKIRIKNTMEAVQALVDKA